MKHLIIVESPAKAKTIKNFLDKNYEVIASKGHVRDLSKFALGIKIDETGFTPNYVVDKDHKELVKQIIELSKKASITYIATDEDREGEAIGYHVACLIGGKLESYPRIVFHEITQNAILNALKTPRKIDMSKVNAQQARRFLDRIVGFKLSSLIASKITKGLSAGRVQSAALKLVIDKEREIKAFKPLTYFTLDAYFESHLEAQLISYKGNKLKAQELIDEKKAQEIKNELEKESYAISSIVKKSKKSPTPPPFMTSTLQQSASSLLGFSPTKTMSIAQKLYEGVATPQGVMGVITYMRTDSLNIAKEALEEARNKILKDYGKDYLPPKAKVYSSKNKNAQEAHEAIRPTSIILEPNALKDYLKPEELRLYTLIYKRFLASQMQDALFESQSVVVACEKGEFKASGRKLLFDGYYKILGNDDKDKLLPNLKENDPIKLEKLESNAHVTEPPARYSEASLIKVLESLGIGRPSTYAPTISLLQNRDYIKVEKKQISALESAFKVIEILEKHFEEIVDSKFSASLEEELDNIAQNKADYQQVLKDFYYPFMDKIEAGKKNIISQKVHEKTGQSCPKCGGELVKKNSRYGEFIACNNYPKCKYVKQTESANDEADQELCEKCGGEMVQKFSRNGAFLACNNYPECKNTKSLKNTPNAKETIEGVKCPECGGDIALKRSKKGSFYGCNNYPKCNFLSNHKPINKRCEKCHYLMSERIYRKKKAHECIKCKERVFLEEDNG
ncbi:type I DNA topoisomerase [Helicobacter pylori]|jgi:DNA topoisomerase I (EC 5.99.1.2)|uniref:DNA topoisomerase 1 n=4 Tax=Helicobacter pylori TaxID=210 RepID=TOP1_HELPY|nr:type I DNA topoisomerase [Helicobacter pylori]P55991.1 RecName: Full=DNA topoisomerase 1; AltName: Full=DNA topoisomerase I; AltName: Full=Omega-protein; AltName: Full=Relaxing enzyme; AltName: Full=Swivelase; AltName: Full=Untwisting enzyme [Helicobacter pylori 26695]AAD07184.1 DNA topoisomerase I (topA) [Helicobacter pylori 26695]AFV41336.1 DNA topoisomerase I [Helicobacter pylori 26695]AFV42929.1 DNA topoisomerase I [Helicobacter pylori Rif1]AFV44524.1 DNA topoisomerase I [Helicobacter p